MTKSPLWIAGALIMVLGLTMTACSSNSSNQNVILCWLRPSCLPSELNSTSPETAKQSKPATKKKAQPVKKFKPAASTAQTPASASANCRTTANTMVKATKPSITMTYTEPTTNEVGKPLTNLAHTTIYYDLGNGLVKAKEVPATDPKGGGKITESIQVPLGSQKTAEATLCITATSVQGRENLRIASTPVATKSSQAQQPKPKPKAQPKKQPSQIPKPKDGFTTPSNGVTVSGTVPIHVAATAGPGVENVQIKIDGSNKFCNLEKRAPYTCDWDSTKVANGWHTLTATILDKKNHRRTVAVDVQVSNTTKKQPKNVPATQTTSSTPSQPSPAKQSARVSPSSHTGSCRISTKTTVTAEKPSIAIAYKEPTTNWIGKPLANLGGTIIYYDIGKGLVKAKEVPATNPKGGGQITESIDIPLGSEKTIEATICVTATTDRF